MKKILSLIFFAASFSLVGASPFQIAHYLPIGGVMVDDVNGYNMTDVGTLTYSTVASRPAVSGFSAGNFGRLPSGFKTAWANAHNAWQIDFQEYEAISVLGGAFVAWDGGFSGCSGATFFGIFGSHVYGLELSNGSSCFDTTAGIPIPGSYHKVTISWDGTNKRYFVDNALVTTDSTSGNYGTTINAVDIGAASDTADGDQPFNGAISEITFWNGAYCASDPCTNPTATNTPTKTNTPVGTLTNTPAQTATNTPTNTPSPTLTATPYVTFTPNVSITPAPANGLDLIPQQWADSFAAVGDNVTQGYVTTSVQTMYNNGMVQAGYRYYVINEGWEAADRNINGDLTWDTTKFPNGIPYVADFCANLGVHLMIYTSVPIHTCTGFPGTGENNITRDANTFASWRLDGVYVDECNPGQLNVITIYAKWWNALAATGRPMFLEASQYGDALNTAPRLWAPKVSNSWRTIADSNDSFTAAITNWLDAEINNAFQKIGSFISEEISSVGRGGQTYDQYRAAKSFNVFGPYTDLFNGDPLTLTAPDLAITNSLKANEIIHDPLCARAIRVEDFSANGQVYWRKLNPTNAWAGLFLNTGATGLTVTTTYSLAAVSYNACALTSYYYSQTATVQNVWAGTIQTGVVGSYSAYVPATGVALFIMQFTNPALSPTISPTITLTQTLTPTPSATLTQTPNATTTPCTGPPCGNWWDMFRRRRRANILGPVLAYDPLTSLYRAEASWQKSEN